MAQATGTLIEVRADPGGLGWRSGKIACPPTVRPAPGQYLMASSPDPDDPLPVALFPAGMEGENLLVAPPLPPRWESGMRLALRGPLGKGFRLPPTARRVALAAFDHSPARLMPLATQALGQRAAVALYTRSAPPPGLPSDVEVLPMDLLPEAPTWADFLALDLTLHDIAAARAALGLTLYARTPCQSQALVITAMPCSGLGECGVCAVLTAEGWRLACEDGPVFDFNRLEVGSA